MPRVGRKTEVGSQRSHARTPQSSNCSLGRVESSAALDSVCIMNLEGWDTVRREICSEAQFPLPHLKAFSLIF